MITRHRCDEIFIFIDIYRYLCWRFPLIDCDGGCLQGGENQPVLNHQIFTHDKSSSLCVRIIKKNIHTKIEHLK